MENRECPTVLADPRNGTPLRLVWHDEFDGNAPDPEKWNQFNRMWGGSDGRRRIITTKSDPRNLSVEHGKLVMRAWREPDADGLAVYSTHETLTTWNRMSFRYGYLEIRARVPFERAMLPSCWFQSVPWHRSVDYMTEVDLFEPWWYAYIESAMHKWYLTPPTRRSPSGCAYAHDWRPPVSFVIPGAERLHDEFHRYGFGWTPQEMYFTFDGNVYGRMDITEDSDFGGRGCGGRETYSPEQYGDRIRALGTGLTGMRGFHDPLAIHFTNFVKRGSKGFRHDEFITDEEQSVFPASFSVDWVRRYQKPGEGALFDDRAEIIRTEEETPG